MEDQDVKNCLVADDHWVARKGLIYNISKKFVNFIFEEASSLDEIIEKLKIKDYDILLFDYDYSDNNIASRIIQIKELAPNSKIIVITSMLTYFQFFYIKDYVNAVISKQSEESRVIEAIKFVSNGYESFFLGLNQKILQKVNLLTEREIEIALLLSKGRGNKEIVWDLNIKETTVSTYRKRIFEKLEITNNVELANFFSNSIL